jgi:hypothetical protein
MTIRSNFLDCISSCWMPVADSWLAPGLVLWRKRGGKSGPPKIKAPQAVHLGSFK